MGLMIDGTYHAEDPGPDSSEDGRFQRQKATIRHWITQGGPFTPIRGAITSMPRGTAPGRTGRC